MPGRINPERLVGGSDQAQRIRKALDQQGAFNPELLEQIGPVAVVDDVSRPPFVTVPVYWSVLQANGPVAAQRAHIGVMNESVGVVVVDRIFVGPSAASRIQIQYATNNATFLANRATVVMQRSRGWRGNTAALAQVTSTTFTNVAILGTNIGGFIAAANVSYETPGPWVLAPGDQLVAVADTVNCSLQGEFMGRWWPELIIG